jgi:hypothetical protein
VDEYGLSDGPWGPVVSTLAGLAGGAGGVTAVNAAETTARGAARAAGKPFGASTDKTINVDPETQMPVSKVVSDAAAARIRGAAADPDAAIERIKANRAEIQSLDSEAPMPSPAALSEDPGLGVLERNIDLHNPVPAMSDRQKFQSGVRDSVERIAPDGADPQSLVTRLQTVADAQREVRTRELDKAQGQATGVQMAREAEAETRVAPYAGRDVPASQALDREIVDRGYLPARREKNRQFDAAPGRTQELDAEDVISAAARVRAQINDLGPDRLQMPAEFVQRLERLAPDIQETTTTSPLLDPYGRPITRTEQVNNGGPGTALGDDLAGVRRYLGTASEQARRAGNFDLVDSIDVLRRSINRTIEAAPGYAEANANYGQFADRYRPSPADPAAQFTRAIDRETPDATGQPIRAATPPSQTAGRFIQPGQPEKMQALTRMVEGAENPAAAQGAAREYLMADMASSGVIDPKTGTLRPDRLRTWSQRFGDVDQLVPGFQRDLNDMLRRAERGEQLAGQFADEVKTAQKNAKLTDAQIDKGALGMVLNADPDKVVQSIMSQTDRTGRLMDDVLKAVGGDQQAKNGLKAAVRDYLTKKVEQNASEKTAPGDRRGPVSRAKLNDFMQEYEKVLPRIFDPEEMNTLRAGHRALELSGYERLRVSSGSDTAEKGVSLIDNFLQSPVGKAAEVALRLKYGLLKAGGIVGTARRAFAGATGGPDPQEITRLMERARFDPELMGLLLGRKLPVGSPRWNKRMNQLLSAEEGARVSLEDDE